MTTLLDKRRKETADKIAVMQAFADGKDIVCVMKESDQPLKPIKYPAWDWVNFNYEVADEKA